MRGAPLSGYHPRSAGRRFNSRTPCGVRPDLRLFRTNCIPFQFTHPVRGATQRQKITQLNTTVSIHAPRAGCDFSVSLIIHREAVSIHAPRAGCDIDMSASRSIHVRFQFTHPVRGATGRSVGLRGGRGVSIHAPRAGCDSSRYPSSVGSSGFNSRTPCGVRLSGTTYAALGDKFQFTHPVRGATVTRRALRKVVKEFQFTHPVRGATTVAALYFSISASFNSRTPCGVRHVRAPRPRPTP